MAGRKRLFDSQIKWCPGCLDWRPLAEFGNCKSAPSGKKSRCKKCFQLQNAPHMRKYLYGISDEERLVMWEKQDKCCAVCHESIPLQGRYRTHVDTDPATKEPRGLLCSRCNYGLKSFHDSQVLLEAATKYLKRFELERRQRRRSGIKPLCSSPA